MTREASLREAVSISWNETRVVRVTIVKRRATIVSTGYLHTERNRRLSKSFVYILRSGREEKRGFPKHSPQTGDTRVYGNLIIYLV